MKTLQSLLILLCAGVLSAKCPHACQCYQQANICSIFCVNRDLTKIPNSFDFYVKVLNFTDNFLPKLTNSFRNPYYKSLGILDLRNNHIEVVNDNSFLKLKNLLEIDLSNNKIGKLNGKLFEHNKFLNTIRLSGNPLNEIKSYAFPVLIYLRNVDFQGCKLKRIHQSAFFNTPQLEYLNLKDNNLKTLSLGILHLTQLKILSLDGNPWKCDKHLWSLLKGLQEKNIHADSMLCVYGETENAIFWDTMEVSKPDKFKTSTRAKRTIHAGDNEELKEFVKKRIESLKALRKREMENWERRTNTERHTDGLPKQNDEWRPTEGRQWKNNVSKINVDFPLNEDDRFPNHQVNRHRHSEHLPHRPYIVDDFTLTKGNFPYPRQHSDKQEVLELNIEDIVDHSDTGKLSMNANLTQLPGEEKSNARKGAEDIHVSSERNRAVTADVSDEVENGNSTNEEGTDFKVLMALIIIEFVLLPVLLYVLFKIWRMNKNTFENGVNVPLNNKEKEIKNYDTQTPGYHRYSLSDDDFPDIRNNHEDGKYDAESGYLSYHRYNSVDGADNTNEHTYYRRFYGNDNDDTTNDHENEEQENDGKIVGPICNGNSTTSGTTYTDSPNLQRAKHIQQHFKNNKNKLNSEYKGPPSDEENSE